MMFGCLQIPTIIIKRTIYVGRTHFAVFVALLMALLSGFAQAQSNTMPALLADNISYDADRDALIAVGNVEIYFDQRTMRASEITYFNETGIVEAKGPITLSAPGEDTIIANFASLDSELKSGLIQGARLVLAENFQFAAQQVDRVNERYSVLSNTVASSCQVCANNPTPLWLVRAERIVRDTKEKQIHFENVRFEAYGITIAALPYFRIPDPSVKRATGILKPQFKSADTYGTGIKLPYFIVIDNHSDITITPFLTTKGTAIIEGEYRRRFSDGSLSFNGAFGIDDDNTQAGIRGFIYADGSFQLPTRHKLEFSIRHAGDKTFLNEFGFTGTDRLTSKATISRQDRQEYVSYSATGFQSLRSTENNNNIPYVLPEIMLEQYWDNAIGGGRLTAHASAVGLTRKLGRDVYKIGGDVDWERALELPAGFRAKATLGLSGWIYSTQDDPTYSAEPQSYLAPTAAIDLRWPLARRTARSVEIIEPVAQIVYRDVVGDIAAIPNEDSVQVEFDASNLFALDRSPGTDLVEEGLRLNFGLNYTHLSDEGWKFGLTLGRVFRTDMLSQFSAGTGLNSQRSNYVAAANFDFPGYFNLSNQTLFDNNLAFSRNDIQASAKIGNLGLSANYVFLLPDITANSLEKRHEITLNSNYDFNANWSLEASYRRNLATGKDVSHDLTFRYGNECITTDFSVSRNFTNSNNVSPATEFGLSVSLAGFGGSGSSRPAQQCHTYE